MRVEYSEPLAAWIFPRQGTHGLYAVDGMDGCSRTRLCLFLKTISCTSDKKQGHGNKRTANSTGRLHNDHHRAACTPYSTLHSSQESRSLYVFHRPSVGCGLLTALWLARHKLKKMYHGNRKEPTTSARYHDNNRL